MAQFHSLKIKEIVKETDHAVTLTFDIPNELKSTFSFKAGQYITLKTTINNEEVRRDYSLCTSPQSNMLKVVVKAVENGMFSVYANTNLSVGDTLEVSGPNGRFLFEPDASKSRTIAAFAAGSGITPIMSIAKTVLEQEPNSHFVLVYGNKTVTDTIFYSELQDLKSKFEDRLHLQFVFSQSNHADALFGRIDASTVNFIVKNKYKDHTIDAFYLCGPEAMIHAVSDTLTENGVAKDSIFYELFTVPVSENESANVQVSDGETQVTIRVDDEQHTFIMSQNDSVLDAALVKDIDAPYSCQGGICSSCLAKITEGEAIMRQNNILTDKEVGEGLVLTCQAHPTTPTLTVDFDDI